MRTEEKKCLEFRVEGKGPKREDFHDRKKWRRNIMKRKSNPIGKRNINRKYKIDYFSERFRAIKQVHNKYRYCHR